MSQTVVLILGLGLGYLLIRKFLFTPSKNTIDMGLERDMKREKKKN